MTSCKRRYTTPVGHGSTLFEPAIAEMPAAVAENQQRLNGCETVIAGRRLSQWRRRARAELLGRAREFTESLSLPAVEISGEMPLIVTGHQCEFYHCGILIKYLLSDFLARYCGGGALNLIVDNDLPKHTDLRVPIRSGADRTVRALSLAPVYPELTMEAQPLLTRENIEKFAGQLESVGTGGPLEGRLQGIARLLREKGSLTQRPAELFTLLNHGLTQEKLGVKWLELPVSVMAGSGSFLGMVCDFLGRGPAARLCYNRALGRYRERNKIPNRSQPMPDLKEDEQEGGLEELPFWLMRRGRGRSGLWVREKGDVILISDGQEEVGEIARECLAGDAEEAVDCLSEILAEGEWAIRPRAVTLTVFARLFLGDYFVHGIGGARYDQVTDEFIREFYGMEPPNYAAASATMYLGGGEGAGPRALRERLRQVRQRERDVRYNPQRYLEGEVLDGSESRSKAESFQRLLVERRQAMERGEELRRIKGDREKRRGVFETLHRLNGALVDRMPEVVERLTRQRQEAEGQLRQGEIAYDREYFFALFTPEQLQLLRDKLAFLLPQRHEDTKEEKICHE